MHKNKNSYQGQIDEVLHYINSIEESNWELLYKYAKQNELLPERAVYTHQGPYSLLDSFYETILKQLPPHYYLGESPILEHYLNSPIDTDSQELLTEIWIPICK